MASCKLKGTGTYTKPWIVSIPRCVAFVIGSIPTAAQVLGTTSGSCLAEELGMTPMTPFYAQPTSQPPRELPGRIKAVLVLKTIGCLIAIGFSLILLLVCSGDHLPEGMTVDHAHKVATFTMIATGASLLELIGVAGVSHFKRWGVYVLSGFSMMSFVFRATVGDTGGALLSIFGTLIVGAAIATSWSDFE